MLIDLHCHTSPRSRCSSLTVEALVARARERGLDGVCLTEHDTAWPAEELAALRERTGFPIFAGVEYTTDVGHVLAFGADGWPGGTFRELSRWAASRGGLLFLAHPFRESRFPPLSIPPGLASFEAVNGSDGLLAAGAARALEGRFALPPIGGSDAHSSAEVGRAATRFARRITTQAELLAELAAGRYQAVWLG